MTVTDTARESVESALEQGPLFSHLNPPPSYDLADHPVPTGREEIWRFTPLKRLRGILDGDASDATPDLGHHAARGRDADRDHRRAGA